MVDAANPGPVPFSRDAGSQGEHPLIVESSNLLLVSGYQQYVLDIAARRIISDRRDKYPLMRPYLLQMDSSLSVMDLGCSAGRYGISALLDGFNSVRFVDHDYDYLGLVDALLTRVGAPSSCLTEHRKFSEIETTYDVVFAISIIHWLYAATEDFGSLDAIVARLGRLSRQFLFVEWVKPEDPCFDLWPQGRPPVDGDNPYTEPAFSQALERHFEYTHKIGRTTPTRELWLVGHRPLPNARFRRTYGQRAALAADWIAYLTPAWALQAQRAMRDRLAGHSRRSSE